MNDNEKRKQSESTQTSKTASLTLSLREWAMLSSATAIQLETMGGIYKQGVFYERDLARKLLSLNEKVYQTYATLRDSFDNSNP